LACNNSLWIRNINDIAPFEPPADGNPLMTAILFDTLKMLETLQAGGFGDQQARGVTLPLATPRRSLRSLSEAT